MYFILLSSSIGSMTHLPLFRVRSGNIGMKCMSFYILILLRGFDDQNQPSFRVIMDRNRFAGLKHQNIKNELNNTLKYHLESLCGFFIIGCNFYPVMECNQFGISTHVWIVLCQDWARRGISHNTFDPL